MPQISRFFGIIIKMYYNDHYPAHFHIEYNDYVAEMSIDTLEIIEGELPRRVLNLVLEWVTLHRGELRENWRRAREHEPLRPIAPLE
jgi:hypothetical protein